MGLGLSTGLENTTDAGLKVHLLRLACGVWFKTTVLAFGAVTRVNYSPCAYFVWFVTLLVLGARVDFWKLVHKDVFTNLTQRKAYRVGRIHRRRRRRMANSVSEDDT